MTDLFSWAEESDSSAEKNTEPKPFTVSELNKKLKTLLEETFFHILVEGEISNFKAHSSGHFYFSLKDEGGQINTVMFRGSNSRLKFKPRDGLKVLVRGNVSVYVPRGNYQIIAETMEPLGDGALRLAFEQLKEKLSNEGLFDPAHKKPLPKIPQTIGIITSPTGAAVRDILNVITRRYPHVHIVILPVHVQGKVAAGEIATAIELADKKGIFDVLIVSRGGGSLEDLWPFNEEVVARALFKCQTPTLSGVGHEIDFTISDYVADVRAPTPSAAAEIVVPNKVELVRMLQQHEGELTSVIQSLLQQARKNIKLLEAGLKDPRQLIQDGKLRLEDLSQQLTDWMKQILSGKKEFLQQQSLLLDSFNPLAVLKRGYSIVTQKEKVLMNSTKVKKGDALHIRLAQGEFDAIVK